MGGEGKPEVKMSAAEKQKGVKHDKLDISNDQTVIDIFLRPLIPGNL